MRKHLSALFLSSGAVALALGLGATTATASSVNATWTVSPGGVFSTSGSGQVKDTNTGTVAKCTSIKLSGTLKSGSGLSGTAIGTIKTASFTGCTIATISVTVTAQNLPWAVNAHTYNVTKRWVKMGIGAFPPIKSKRGIRLLATAPGCSANLEGSSAVNGYTYFQYSDSTGKLTLTGPGSNLVAANVSGCFGLINNGDPQQASGPSTISPLQNITSP